jgi:enoyl-[acyl-carrier protein] reductase II
MGTRMLSSEESPVHTNYKQAVIDAPETGTVFLNRFAKPGFRVLATPFSEQLEREERVSIGTLDAIFDLYFEGNLDAAFAFGGQVSGRIEDIRPVAEIISETIDEFHAVVRELAARFEQ